MSRILISNLTFAYDGSFDNVFTDASFTLDTDWKLGFCGRNGRGKTTLLHLLTGRYEYAGAIAASVEFEYFPYDVADQSRSAIEILTELSPASPLWEIQKELGKLHVSEDAQNRPFYSLSNGERTKALLAGLFLRENSFPLIDEPTNHLDMAARETVARYLKSKQGFILVSHDRAFLDACVDHILSINRATIDVMSGNFSSWWEQKRRQDAHELAQSERLGREIDRLKIAARKTSNWSDKVENTKYQAPKSGLSAERGHIGRMAAKMMKRSKTIERRRETEIEEKSKLLKDVEKSEALLLRPGRHHASRLVSLRGLSLCFGGRIVFKGFDLTLEQGDRLALTGANGTGKSSILRLVSGESVPASGIVEIASGLTVSCVPQDASFLTGGLTEFAEARKIDVTRFMTVLRKFDFPRAQFEKDMRELSAGQKKKVLLAASLCEEAHLYVWDEPLNYIDVFSRVQLEQLILEYRPSMLFVEHDRMFCRNVATRIVEI